MPWSVVGGPSRFSAHRPGSPGTAPPGMAGVATSPAGREHNNVAKEERRNTPMPDTQMEAPDSHPGSAGGEGALRLASCTPGDCALHGSPGSWPGVGSGAEGPPRPAGKLS